MERAVGQFKKTEKGAVRTRLERMQDRAKDVVTRLHLVPDDVAQKWAYQKEDRLHAEWEASPQGKQWEREQEELAHFGKVLTANDYAEKRADLENDATIDRGDIGWMMEKWAGNPNWRETYDRDAADELKSAREHEERMVRRWEKSPEGKQYLQEQEGRVNAHPTKNPREEWISAAPTTTGEWTHKDNVIYDRETRMSKALSALDRGDIAAAKVHLAIPDKVRDVYERDSSKSANIDRQKPASKPPKSISKPKDRDFDMEM